MYIWSLSCAACNAHPPYCYLWPAPHYKIFPRYLTKGTIKKNIEYKMCVLVFSTNFVRNISRRELREILLKMCICLHVKYPLYLSNFNETWSLSTDFFEKCSNFVKTCSVGAELFRASRRTEELTDRQTDITKLIAVYR